MSIFAVNGTMIARAVFCIAMFAVAMTTSVNVDQTVEFQEHHGRKLDLSDGLYVELPGDNATEKLFSFGVDGSKDVSEGRGKQKKLMQRILPLFIMPFIMQSTIVPLFLGMLKFMLFKSMMVGKLALFLIALNAFKNHNSFKGRTEEVASVHYGYHGNGMEEYGAYINS